MRIVRFSLSQLLYALYFRIFVGGQLTIKVIINDVNANEMNPLGPFRMRLAFASPNLANFEVFSLKPLDISRVRS